MSEPDPRLRIIQLEAENGRLRRLLDEKGIPSSFRHQVRNALATLRVVIRRSAETSTAVEDYAAHLEGRFDALLRSQAFTSWSREGVDLYTLVADEMLAHAVQQGNKADIEGPDVRLPAKTAEIIGLALHELMTNAVKFGAMTQPEGRIRVAWTVDAGEPNILTLSWTESGLSGLDTRPTFRGFGSEVLHGMLPHQLEARARVDFQVDGLRCEITMPLAG